MANQRDIFLLPVFVNERHHRNDMAFAHQINHSVYDGSLQLNLKCRTNEELD